MLYRRNRYYDPAAGRFTQEDPLGLAGGLNLYGFAKGDPVNLSDPLGLQADTTRHDRCEVAAILRNYVDALESQPGRFASGYRFDYPREFDFKFTTPNDLYEVDHQWLRADQFGNYAAGYAGEAVYGGTGYWAMRAGGIRFASEKDAQGNYISGEDPSDRQSVPMINAGARRALLDRGTVEDGFLPMPPPPAGGPLTQPASCPKN